MNSIDEIVSIEEEKLKNSSSPGEKINILHNLIVLKNHSPFSSKSVALQSVNSSSLAKRNLD